MKLSCSYLFHFILLINVYIIKSEVNHADINNAPESHRIAIIGAGIGDTATAYFLHQLTGGHALIDVYESGHVGGRAATASIRRGHYDVGAIILHPNNQHMKQFVEELGLSSSTKLCGPVIGLFNGTELGFRTNVRSWLPITAAKTLRRYGWSVFNLFYHSEDYRKKFTNIYSLQQNGAAYRTTQALLHAIHPSLPALTQTSTRQYLQEKLGISEKLVSELIGAFSIAFHGQTPDNMHAFAGSMFLPGLNNLLWHVAGGNRRVPEQLLLRSGATLLRRHATQVAVTGKNVDGRDVYQVSSVEPDNSNGGLHDLYTEGGYPRYRSSQQQQQQKNKDARVEGAEDVHVKEYDAVIVATPLTADKSDLKFINTAMKYNFPGEYERFVMTLVKSKLRNGPFTLSGRNRVDAIFMVNKDRIFHILGPVTSHEDEDVRCDRDRPTVYLMGSPQPLTPEQLQQLFVEVNSTRDIDWRAFPHYEPRLATYPSFELQPGLYHNNAIEWLASGMEMSAIAAKNVALLAFKHLTGDSSAGSSGGPNEGCRRRRIKFGPRC